MAYCTDILTLARSDSSGVSHTTGLQLQTILNAEDSPSRVSVPETPVSARGSLQVLIRLGSYVTRSNYMTADTTTSHPGLPT